MTKRKLFASVLWIIAVAAIFGAAVGMVYIDDVDNQIEAGHVIVADKDVYTVDFRKSIATVNGIEYNGRSVIENLPGDLVSITYHDQVLPVPLAVVLFFGIAAGIPTGCAYLWGKVGEKL